jgi:phosphate transport system substrate-binding protein
VTDTNPCRPNRSLIVKKTVRVSLLCLLALSLAAPVAAETLTIPGSGNPEYVLGELAKAFNSQQKQHQVLIPPTTGTAGALRDVTQGTASIGRVGRPLKDVERTGGMTYHPLGRDPIAFAGGALVTGRTITRAQIVDIYAGKLTNWRDLGSKPGPIRAIGREVTDASRQAIARDIKVFASMVFDENVKIVNLDTQMIELLDRFPTSIGFLNRSALMAAKTRPVLLALDRIEPTADNVRSGRYPFWLEFGLIYQAGALTPAGQAFLTFVDSPAGVHVLRSNGVLPAEPRR